VRIVLYLAGKDLLLRWRDRLGFFWWMVGFPLLIAVLIGQIFAGVLEGPSRAMTVAMVDEENSPQSREYVQLLESSGGLDVEPMSRAQAQDAVRQGKLGAFVLLRPGFRISPAMFFGKPLPLAVGVDPIRSAEFSFVQASLNEGAITLLSRQWVDPQRRSELIENWLADAGRSEAFAALQGRAVEATLATLERYLGPIAPPAATQPAGAKLTNVELIPLDMDRPRSSFEICFPLGIIWGLLGLAAEFAMAIAEESGSGTFLRMRVAPIRRWQILAGHGLACFVSALGVSIFLLAIGHLFFGVRLQSPTGLLLALPCIGFCFVGLALLLSALGQSESAVGGAAWAILLVLAMIGGGMVPDFFLPPWIETAGRVSPVKWAILGLQGGVWRDFSLAEMLRPCGILLLQGSLFAVVGLTLRRRREAG
jgi:ABC-2 type transport system permease protein